MSLIWINTLIKVIYILRLQNVIFPELLRHQQTAGLSVCGAEPPRPVLQEASQDDDAEAESAEFVHHHHQDLLPGKNLSNTAALSLGPCVHVCMFVWQDLVFFVDDCEAIDTGHGTPHYAEDRLQLLKEER